MVENKGELKSKMPSTKEEFWSHLSATGMPAVPEEFGVTFAHQTVPAGTVREIERFIHVFEAVTTRPTWQNAVAGPRSAMLRTEKQEVCFFSAWDFHLPPDGPWQVIEFNDNGSGLLYAALINSVMHDLLGAEERAVVVPPPSYEELCANLKRMVRREATEFFGTLPDGLFLILDDPESLKRGKFLREMQMLRDLMREDGLTAEVGAVTDLRWRENQLLFLDQPVAFVVNRSTDFFLESEISSALREAFRAGSVYIAPNPFTYATRSDKRLLEFFSNADRDAELGIRSDERDVLSVHVPATHLLRSDNIDAMVEHKEQLVFKPINSHASRGFLPSSQVGRSRLNRLVRKGDGYVSQRKIGRPQVGLDNGGSVWVDLRVWAYRGELTLLSGRASVRGDMLDLAPPGGWLPTFAGK